MCLAVEYRRWTKNIFAILAFVIMMGLTMEIEAEMSRCDLN